MKKWKMVAADAYHLLTVEQNFRCALSGRALRPQNTSIVHKVPRLKGGKHQLSNIYLVDSSLASLARKHSYGEIIKICECILNYRTERTSGTPPRTMDSKKNWEILLFRMATFNRSAEQKPKNEVLHGRSTWGKVISDELSRINRTK